MDPNRTMTSTTPTPISPPPKFSATQPPIAQDTNFGASFDSMAGTVSGAQLDKEVPKVSVDHTSAQERQQTERDRKEQEQQEKLERMALQAQELEDRLERLSGSMPPSLDPETTRVAGSATSPERVANTGAVQSVGPGKPMIVDFGQKRKTPPFVLIGVALFVLVLAGVGTTAYFMLKPGSGKTDTPATPTPVVPPKTKAELLPIVGGTFLMGRRSGPPQETPAHAVTVQPFQMDRTEISNSEYAEFVSETNHGVPAHWAGKKPPFGQEMWPVVNVSFNDATTFAAWRSKRDGVSYRLPTEEEWEYAARNGEKSDLYPWGPDWKDNVAVLKEATPAAVGSLPGGKNQWGVFDLIGNVWEWTASKASVYPGNRVEVPASMQDWVTIRGGCYVSDPAKADAPVSSCLREFVPPSTKTTLLGFRLVRSGP
jgi:formylglycine-generating enzyme required for sulfatase activity